MLGVIGPAQFLVLMSALSDFYLLRGAWSSLKAEPSLQQPPAVCSMKETDSVQPHLPTNCFFSLGDRYYSLCVAQLPRGR